MDKNKIEFMKEFFFAQIDFTLIVVFFFRWSRGDENFKGKLKRYKNVYVS